LNNKYLLTEDLLLIKNGLLQEINQFEGKVICLTGAMGFVGRYFISFFDFLNKEVLKKPLKVFAFDNFISSSSDVIDSLSLDKSNIFFEKKDVCKSFNLTSNVDFIIHAAGIASPYYYRKYPLETINVGFNATKNILEIAKKKKSKVIFFSSSEIYGNPDPKFLPIEESYKGYVSCVGPRACYDESKRIGETLCAAYHEVHSVHANMIRPFNVYGPGMLQNDYRVLPNFAVKFLKKENLKIYGKGNQTRTFCYITDAIIGFLKVLVHGLPGQPYNIGNPKPEISMIDLAKLIKKKIGSLDFSITDYPDSYPADEPERRCPSIYKAEIQLNYKPEIELVQGLLKFFGWCEQHYKL